MEMGPLVGSSITHKELQGVFKNLREVPGDLPGAAISPDGRHYIVLNRDKANPGAAEFLIYEGHPRHNRLVGCADVE
jgi:hypothetical protein